MPRPMLIATPRTIVIVAIAARAATLPGVAHAQAGHDATALSKQTQNPIADLVSLPFQMNFITGGAFDSSTFFNLNFQPVLPLSVGKNFNVIARTIVPYVSTPTPVARFKGIGDITEQLLFTPKKAMPVTVGVGPVFSFPTATNAVLRTDDWAVGPGVVLVRNTGPWVIGALLTQVWTFAGDEHRDVNEFEAQPFINYNLADGWALVSAPLITGDFAIEDGQQWTVPLGGGITKVTSLGSRPISVGIQYYANVTRPEASGAYLIRFVASFLFPNAPARPTR